MLPRSLRAIATVAVMCSAGAQVAAGMVGNHLWQLVFLLLTMLSAGIGGWFTMAEPPFKKVDWNDVKTLKRQKNGS